MKTFDTLKKECPLTIEEQAELDFKIKLISKLIELRKEKNLTQAQFAQLCGCKQSFIARLETKADRALQVETLIRLTPAWL
jgi:DNA-binding XRE family transcriptional regulator